jgi:Tfp pilus assembly protein PilF
MSFDGNSANAGGGRVDAAPELTGATGPVGDERNGASRGTSEGASVCFARGLAAQREGKHDRALEEFDKAIADNSQNADCHWHRAGAYAALGRLEEATDGYREAIRLRPDFAPYREARIGPRT